MAATGEKKMHYYSSLALKRVRAQCEIILNTLFGQLIPLVEMDGGNISSIRHCI